MCGIAGIFKIAGVGENEVKTLTNMLGFIKHRGPDEFGIYSDRDVGLSCARLSILDLQGGIQPIHNEDESIWTVFNGEIYNYDELKAQLQKKGHKFYTKTDTEVLVHLYEENGLSFLNQLNGQFAFAIWDKRLKQLMLARDRIGIRPLYYTMLNDKLFFSSEMKSFLAEKTIKFEVEPKSLDQIFTFWTSIPPLTIFKNIWQIPPGNFLIINESGIKRQKYWDLSFPDVETLKKHEDSYYIEHLHELIIDSVRLRLKADVPVGVYLSGGIDSSTIAAVVKNYTNNDLRTFSISFLDAFYDESKYQQEMIDELGSVHHGVSCADNDIGKIFDEVIWHTEAPILRTAPAPLYMLSEIVNEKRYKVVLTGEGGDEIFLGYNLFKENKIRRCWSKHPERCSKTSLLKTLYPYLQLSQLRSRSYLEAFFGYRLEDVGNPFYSHLVRWNNTAKAKKFFSEHLKRDLSRYDSLEEFQKQLGAIFDNWHYQSKAQYLEIKTLLTGYLLSSQGDRMAMAHSVEGRFPFLDHRVIEFASQIPQNLKLRAMNEKYILKRCFEKHVPRSIRERPKKAYRAPNIESFFKNGKTLDYVEDILSSQKIQDAGIFEHSFVEKLVRKYLTKGKVMGEVDNMALVGIISTQILFDQYCRKRLVPKRFRPPKQVTLYKA